jgi:ABC-type dipeptide/oligopeptide/nickel transport system ATPase component
LFGKITRINNNRKVFKMALAIKQAARQALKGRILLTGASGTGKTYTALTIARKLSPDGMIVVIDTESAGQDVSASEHYADIFKHHVLPVTAPYSPVKFTEAIQMAVNAGAEVIVWDSMTHEWSESGGMLDMVSQQDAIKGQSGWLKTQPLHDRMMETIKQCPVHFIATARTKNTIEVSKVEGKNVTTKVPNAIIQKPGLEYEFDIHIMMHDSGNGGQPVITIEKSRFTELPQHSAITRNDPLLASGINSGLNPENADFPKNKAGFASQLRVWGVVNNEQKAEVAAAIGLTGKDVIDDKNFADWVEKARVYIFPVKN